MSEQKITSDLVQEISTEEQQLLSGGNWGGGPWGRGGWGGRPWGRHGGWGGRPWGHGGWGGRPWRWGHHRW